MPLAVPDLVSVDPTSEVEIARYRVMDAAALDAVLATVAAQRSLWKTTPMLRRAQLLRDLAGVLRKNATAYAARMTAEMGKPTTEAAAEIEKCATTCDYFAENALTFLADETVESDSSRSHVRYEPLGAILAGMPWNFPFWQVIRCAAPALAAGNSVLLKHADNVTGCALDIEAAFREAGFPDGVFRTLVIPIDRVAAVIADSRIAAVSLTGSPHAGEAVAAQAGAVLKKCVLELGGSDAFIVLDDADVSAAAATAVRSRFQNAGQSCIAAKRFIVSAAVADDFVDAVVANVDALRLGDPRGVDTQMGPLARADLRDAIERQIAQSVAAGARHVRGGTRLARSGYFLTPAVITDCRPGMAAFDEETFGPLAAVMVVADDAAAVAAANATDYGLGGSVWTRDSDRGLRVARQLETGGVFINGITHSDPHLPFGGVRRSGYGRELFRHGIHEFVNVKTVWIADD